MLAIGAFAWQSKPYSSGEVMSKETFKYGRFGAAVKPSKQLGSWTSFYLMGEENSSKVEIWNEWSAIHYLPISDPPFFTKGGSAM
jgi:beta-glucanase (GH16 family)